MRTHSYPTDRSNTTQVAHYILLLSIVYGGLEHEILISLIGETCGLRAMRLTPFVDQRYYDTLDSHVSING
jgi:hypothetical protein